MQYYVYLEKFNNDEKICLRLEEWEDTMGLSVIVILSSFGLYLTTGSSVLWLLVCLFSICFSSGDVSIATDICCGSLAGVSS